jgi:hypothetical protein
MCAAPERRAVLASRQERILEWVGPHIGAGEPDDRGTGAEFLGDLADEGRLDGFARLDVTTGPLAGAGLEDY